MADTKPVTDASIEDLFGSGGRFGQPEDRVEAAARSLADALLHHKGRRKAVGGWKPVVRKALRVSKMGKAQFDAVVHRGVELGLFHVDSDSLTFPVLVAGPGTTDDTSPEPVEVETHASERPPLDDGPAPNLTSNPKKDEEPQKPASPSKTVSKEPPKGWNPPEYLDCGHWDWQTYSDPDWTPPADAKVKGMVKAPTITVRATSPDDCYLCKQGRPGHPQHQKGKYRTPVPEKQRRTREREEGLGWPGYCSHPDTGLYIGGLANHCRHHNPKGPWCEVHGGKPVPKDEPEEKPKPKRRKRKSKPKGILADAEKGAGVLDASSALAAEVKGKG